MRSRVTELLGVAAILVAGALVVALATSSRGSLGVSAARADERSPAAALPPYDPAEAARAAPRLGANAWATIPPQCWTKTDAGANPCWSCHVPALPPNDLADWNLQEQFAFPPEVTKNPWTNLFVDRTAAVAAITDEEVLAWVRADNYAPLRAALVAHSLAEGYSPDLDFAAGFDALGFALDGSGWRALRYKPFPGAFWPTNGSTDDVFIRLPEPFRTDAAGKPSVAVYCANLSILEAAIASDPVSPDRAVRRDVEPLDERTIGLDLDADGVIGTAAQIAALPTHYVGGAAGVAVRRRLYPVGTEFLHSVRYLDPDEPSLMARRMKELRYSQKEFEVSSERLAGIYVDLKGEEAEEAAGGEPPPSFEGTALSGLRNRFGWRLRGFIEDASGRLRLQNDEEHLFCMGCHSTLGATVDQTFAFGRKLPGAAGWRPQDLRGQSDAPQVGHIDGEVLTWARRAQGGDEFRGNAEFAARFLPGGVVDEASLRHAAPGGDRDLAWLLAPSRERALRLNKAYLVIVREQSFVKGRDPSITPVTTVHAANPAGEPGSDGGPATAPSTGLKELEKIYRDGRPLLRWPREGPR